MKSSKAKPLSKVMHWSHLLMSNRSNAKSQYVEALDLTNQTGLGVLIRETLQNVMDAGSPNVTFEWKTFSAKELEVIGWSELMERGHKLKDIEKLRDMKTVNCLIIRDSGPGLGGNYTTAPDEDETPGNFQALVRSVANSSKGAGNSGSKGIGSNCSLLVSLIKSVLYFTRRSEDGKALFTGKNDMNLHKYQGKSYQYDGMFVTNIEDSYQPAEDKVAEDLGAALGLEFGKDESGLCVFIPAICDAVNPSDLVKNILRDYFIPVVREEIAITVKSPDMADIVINVDTITDLSANPKYGLSAEHSLILQSCMEAFNAAENPSITIAPSRQAVTKEILDDEDLKFLFTKLKDEDAVGISVGFDCVKKGGLSELPGRIDYGIVHVPGLSKGMKIQVRDGISVVKTMVGRPYIILTTAGFSDNVGAMLRDGENTSHNEWSVDRMLEKDWEDRSASAVCSSFKKGGVNLLNAINQKDVEDDGCAFADLIHMPEDGKPMGKKPKTEDAKDSSGSEDGGEGVQDPTLMMIEPIEMNANGLWGFRVRLNDKGKKRSKGQSKLDLGISTAYASSEKATDPLRHSTSDFDLRSLDVLVKGCDDHEVLAGAITVKNVKPDFEIEVIGDFDENRHLSVASLSEGVRRKVKTKTAE